MKIVYIDLSNSNSSILEKGSINNPYNSIDEGLYAQNLTNPLEIILKYEPLESYFTNITAIFVNNSLAIT